MATNRVPDSDGFWRSENPGVGGSIPSQPTNENIGLIAARRFVFLLGA
jgi:hypothetical protein